MDRKESMSAQVDIPDGLDAPLPIFEVQKVDMQFAVAAEFVAAQVSNNVLILALQSGKIMRIDLDNPTDIDGISASSTISRHCIDFEYHRYRSTKESFGSRCHPAHVSGSYSFASHR